MPPNYDTKISHWPHRRLQIALQTGATIQQQPHSPGAAAGQAQPGEGASREELRSGF